MLSWAKHSKVKMGVLYKNACIQSSEQMKGIKYIYTRITNFS